MAAKQLSDQVIFEVVRNIEPREARLTYLEQVCGDDLATRQRIEALLQAHDESASFLETPPAAVARENNPTIDRTSAEQPGTQIGPYKLLQQIGEGGMGVVYMAEQSHPVQRRVALKVVKPGMDSRQVIARFEAERQALSLMDHPNIAKVLDAGTTEWGRPYFVMELVRGVPITHYCDEHHLTPRKRLELLVPVCQAIQHAHQKGIIHRDIKPTNILIAEYDHEPVPKVIDFGVAKAISQALTEKTMFTGFGQLVGTLEYMSPEQAKVNQLDIDTRSDIYSLGVLLYELLTGSTPLDKDRLRCAAWDEMLRIIREEEPPTPSTRLSSSDTLPSIAANRSMEPSRLGRTVRGELDWIVMKCLEKDRNRRYETASGFVADLQRYLNNEPVQACPPSAAYRFRKFAQRNMATVVMVAAILFVLLGGIAGTTFGLIRAEYRRGEAEQSRADEEAQRKIADAEKKKAEQAEAETLADYRASTDDAIEQLIGSKPDLGPQEKAYLEKTLKRWQAFASRQGNDERSQTIRAEGHHRVALLWARLGRRDEARPEFETACDLYEKLVTAFPTVRDYRYELARTRTNLGLLLASLGQSKAARTELETARELFKQLSTASPGVSIYQQKLAISHNGLGSLLSELGQHELARIELESARDLRMKLTVAFPTVPDYQQDLARSHYTLGGLLSDLGQREAARTEHAKALDLRRRLVSTSPNVPQYRHDLAYSHIAQANMLFQQGERDAARAEFGTALDLLKKLAVDFPARPKFQEDLAGTHNRLGATLAVLGQHDLARTEFETARDVRKKLTAAFPAVPEYQRALAETCNNLGNVLSALDQREAARTQYEAACGLQKKLVAEFPAVPKHQQELARTHNNLGNMLSRIGERGAARLEYETARDVYEKLTAAFPDVPEYKEDLGASCFSLANLIREGGRPEESLHWYGLAIRTLTPVYEQDPRAVRAREILHGSHSNRAMAYDQLKKHAEGMKDWKKAIEVDPTSAVTYTNLGTVLSNQGKLPEAIAAYQDAIKLDPQDARAHCDLALALVRLDDPSKLTEAIAAAEKAIELNPKSANPHNVRGMALSDQKKLDDAVVAYQKAIELDPKLATAHYNLGNVFCRQGKLEEGSVHLREAIKLDPNHVDSRSSLHTALGHLAWRLAAHPEATAVNFTRAIELAKEAVELAPETPAVWQYLGWVHYRAGNWQESIETLEKPARLVEGGTGDASQWIVLALAHAKLAAKDDLTEKDRTYHATEARRHYEQADKQIGSWYQERPAHLRGQAIWDFRLEARKLLGTQEATN